MNELYDAYFQIMIDHVQTYINMENDYEKPPKLLDYKFEYSTVMGDAHQLNKLEIKIFNINHSIFAHGVFTGKGLNIIEKKLDDWLERIFSRTTPRDKYLKFQK